MKNIILILITTFTLFSCSKDDDKPKTELEKLPPATQTGANTAGCLVDGQAFLAKGYIPSGNLVCNYIDGKDFSLGIMQINNTQTIVVDVITYNQILDVGQTYQLKEYGADSKFGEYTIFENTGRIDYRTTTTITGELKITNHNFDKAILSGTFWFDAVNKNGEIIKIREGRFDMQY